MIANLIAVLWGFAEATVFFVAPDFWLSIVAARSSLRRALIACVCAASGALVGGVVMYLWSVHDLEAATRAADMAPAISAGLIARISQEIRDYGVWAMFIGPFSGGAYKIYAVRAADGGIGLLAFALVSIPARLLRFVIVSTLVHLLATRVLGNWSVRRKLVLLLSCWLIFYSFYFSLMPN